jgi:hypothetical protein
VKQLFVAAAQHQIQLGLDTTFKRELEALARIQRKALFKDRNISDQEIETQAFEPHWLTSIR